MGGARRDNNTSICLRTRAYVLERQHMSMRGACEDAPWLARLAVGVAGPQGARRHWSAAENEQLTKAAAAGNERQWQWQEPQLRDE